MFRFSCLFDMRSKARKLQTSWLANLWTMIAVCVDLQLIRSPLAQRKAGKEWAFSSPLTQKRKDAWQTNGQRNSWAVNSQNCFPQKMDYLSRIICWCRFDSICISGYLWAGLCVPVSLSVPGVPLQGIQSVPWEQVAAAAPVVDDPRATIRHATWREDASWKSYASITTKTS